jgi:hypothetical protein
MRAEYDRYEMIALTVGRKFCSGENRSRCQCNLDVGDAGKIRRIGVDLYICVVAFASPVRAGMQSSLGLLEEGQHFFRFAPQHVSIWTAKTKLNRIGYGRSEHEFLDRDARVQRRRPNQRMPDSRSPRFRKMNVIVNHHHQHSKEQRNG